MRSYLQTGKLGQTNESVVGRHLGDENLPPRGEKGWSEIGRGERKHLLFLGAAYGNRDLILASSRRWLRTREMKGRHMGATAVVLKDRREKLPVCRPSNSSRLNYHVVFWSETTVEATYAR